MKVELKRYTQDALELLVDTKSTRLKGKSADKMSEQELYGHYQYMLDTIRSPFEFVDYIFEIKEVSKNFTHQLVRTRTGAYQQESSRAVEVDETIIPENLEADEEFARLFWNGVADANATYRSLIESGAALQDARAILPSNMSTSILAKFNLRTLSDMAKLRLCPRTQGEYQNVFRAMRKAVLEVHPWAEPLLQVNCVATGQCAFPRWGGKVVIEFRKEWHYQCPFYESWMDTSTQREALRIKFWSKEEIAQANPIAKNGVTM